ncbi:MAG: hypothetical protein M3024_06325 [Candidatus Dormibacteraeota bacterium]|nr:hypothetical protein [Candidatus Dormibacteraeota bacterium]
MAGGQWKAAVLFGTRHAEWREPYRALWESRLDRPERHLDAMPDLEVDSKEIAT